MAVTSVSLGSLTSNTASTWTAIPMSGEVIVTIGGTFDSGTATLQLAYSASPAAAGIFSLDVAGTNDEYTANEAKLFTLPAGAFLRMDLNDGVGSESITGEVRDARGR